MRLPAQVIDTRNKMFAKFPLSLGMLPGDAKDNLFRDWCIQLAKQLNFSFPDQGWGVKKADSGRPISKDTIAKLESGRILIWDLFSGVGTSSTTTVNDPDSQDVTGQVFVSVGAQDFLGITPPTPGNPDPPATSGVDLTPILVAIEASKSEIIRRFDEFETKLPGLLNKSLNDFYENHKTEIQELLKEAAKNVRVSLF